MMTIRRSDERGDANHGWLRSKHTFSFANYYDPRHMGFRSLRVINEDRVAAGAGFPTHPHRDMEIISYVLDGALEHKDTIGTGSVIRPGDVQRMTAGSGIAHSEFNHSKEEGVHFLQIWVLPNQRYLDPSYEQKAFPREEKLNKLRLVASPDGRDDSVVLHQDAELYVSLLDADAEVTHTPQPGHGVWVQVVRGAVALDGERLEAGDGASLEDTGALTLKGLEDAEVLVFDLA
ncbi:MAG: pirin family protein [Myxococcota bacterium]